jgi:cytochrome c peroxidase
MWTFRGCRLICLAATLCGISGCGRGDSAKDVSAHVEPAHPLGKPITIAAPLGLPPVPVPADNPPTAETIALGKTLFFSTALSVDGTLSCSSCHNPATAFVDGRKVSIGVHVRKGTRNAPTVLNAAYHPLQFWDGRAEGLEGQASGPMFNSVEMGHTLEGVEQSCSRDSNLCALFEQAFGPGPPTMEKITKAIASFERTLVSGNSPFDRFFYGGAQDALSASAKRGFDVFRSADKGNCAVCHTVGEKFALFTDQTFHNLGAGLSPEGEITDLGRYSHTRREGDQGSFRTPSLRNVARTAPYMHDGSLKTLKDVVDFYVGGGSSNPYLDKLIKPLTHLTRQERADLVAFLESLNGEEQ